MRRHGPPRPMAPMRFDRHGIETAASKKYQENRRQIVSLEARLVVLKRQAARAVGLVFAGILAAIKTQLWAVSL